MTALVGEEKLGSATKKINKEDKKPLLTSKDRNSSTTEIKVYRSRWLMLFIFSMNTMVNGMLFMGLSPVSSIVGPYFDVKSVVIEWLSNMFMLVYVMVALPSSYVMSRWGIRPIIVIGAGLDSASTALRYAGYKSQHFHFVIIGQVLAAVSFGTMMQIPGKLSHIWFPEHERATSTSVAVFMNIFGVAVGFLQTTHMIIPSSDPDVLQEHIKRFFLSQVLFCVVVFFLTFAFYREQPDTPSSKINEDSSNKYGFFQTLAILFKNPYFFFMSQSYGIYYALYVTVSILLSPILVQSFGQSYAKEIGWMGFTCDSVAIFSCFVIGLWLDRYHRYRAMAIFLNFSSTIVWGVFVVLFLKTSYFYGMFAVVSLLGMVGIPYFACGIEQAAEMTFPVTEGISSTVLLILGNLYGFIMVLTLGSLTEHGRVNITLFAMLGFYVLSTLLSCFAKTELKRKHAEEFAEKLSKKKVKRCLTNGWVNIKFKKEDV